MESKVGYMYLDNKTLYGTFFGKLKLTGSTSLALGNSRQFQVLTTPELVRQAGFIDLVLPQV